MAEFACTVEQIEAFLDRGGSSADYTAQSVLNARTVATEALEQECGVAFREKPRTDVLTGTSDTDLLLPVARPLEVTVATIDGTDVLADVMVDTLIGALYRAEGWSSERYGVTVTYTHGYATTPADASRAIAMLAASLIKDGPFDDRGFGVTDDGGFVRLLTAGVSGAAFSIPDVEAVRRRYRFPVVG